LERKKAATAAADACQVIVGAFDDNILKKSSWGAATIKQGEYCDHIGNCKANKERFKSSAYGYYNPLRSGCGKLEGDFKKLQSAAAPEEAPPAQGGARGRKSRRRRRKSRRRKATKKRSGRKSGRNRRRRRRTVKKA